MDSQTWISPANSFMGIGAFQDGFSHLVALCEDEPLEGVPTSYSLTTQSVNALTWENMILAKSFDSNLDLKSEAGDRMIGEGIDPTSFALTGADNTVTMETPLLVTPIGWLDPVFLRLWELCRNAAWGSGAVVTGLLTRLASVSDGDLFISNIEDFKELTAPFAATIITEDGATLEAITVTDCDKANCSLTLQSPLSQSFPQYSQIIARAQFSHGPRTEPCVTLYSTQEGKFSPAMVNKISLEIEPRKTISATIEFASLGVDRFAQIPLRAVAPQLVTAYSRRSPVRLIEGQSVQLFLLTTTGDTYGLSALAGDPLMAGYQGIDIPEFTITGISISIDNRLQPVHTAKALRCGSAKKRTLHNRFGLALVSEGRVVSGSIKYRSPLTPRAVAERLAGPGTLQGGGLHVNFGNVFVIELNDVTWGVSQGRSSADGLEERTLEFSMVSRTRDSMPELLWYT